jgi:hypothetical protein
MSQPLYHQGKSPWYPLDRMVGELQGQSGCSSEEKNSQPLPGLEPPIIQLIDQCYTTEKYYKIIKVILKVKKQHYNRLIAECDDKIKITWNKIKKESGKIHVTEQMPSLLTKDEKMKDPEKVADVINSFFLSIAENLNQHQVQKEDPITFSKDSFLCNFHGIKTVPISEAEIKSIILSPKSKNSSGYDEMSKILKACVSLISRPIYNDSLYRGIFPNHLKISIVKPLFKKGDKTSMTNYMPISLLMVSSKVLGKVMYNRLSHHMHTNNILVPEQFGFRQRSSTECYL